MSSVHLITECLSRLEMKVSCLSEGGDSPQYIWTLNGDKLTDSELLSANNENNIIILRHSVSGSLACSVRNHISIGSTEQIISACKGRKNKKLHVDLNTVYCCFYRQTYSLTQRACWFYLSCVVILRFLNHKISLAE